MADPKAIYDEILKFSGKQPVWVQDMLRRLVSAAESPTASDLSDAVAMCQAAHGLLDASEAPTPVPLAKTHLPATATSNQLAVTLTKLHDFEHVNALLPGQTLPFSPTGLTAIYGTNGAGKSGYARVLKHLCRARGAVAPILPDVFAKSPGTPTASVTYEVGGSEHVWRGALDASGLATPEALSRIAVYDRAAGMHTVETEQAVTLLPPGLDLLPMLKDVLDYVMHRLKADPAGSTSIMLPTLHSGTSSSTFLAKLSKDTTAAELDAVCAWTDDDESDRVKAVAAVNLLKANDPNALVKKATKRAERLGTLIDALDKAGKDLCDDVVALADQRIAELSEAQEAVYKNAGDALPADALPGTGEAAWRLMWKAARDFSTQHAYPSHDFPHTTDEARCVLCQQELDEDARGRLNTFEAYVMDALSKNLKSAQDAVANAVKHMNSAVDPGLVNGNLLAVLDEIDELDADALQPYIDAAVARRDAVLARLDPEQADIEVPALPDAPTGDLAAAKDAAKTDAANHAKTDATQAMADAEAAMYELEDRKALFEARSGSLEPEIERRSREAKIKLAKKDCSTSKLSLLAGKLTETHVTDALVNAFNTELKALGGDRLKVAVEKARTKKGTTFTGLVLKNAEHNKAVVHSVFSEGEQRAVALAWFFAELSLSADASAIVFDDPVTSLDHDWRGRIADRLAMAAATRQVVVFTHDIMFLCQLREASTRLTASHNEYCVQRLGKTPGHCSTDIPWESRGVKQRVKDLGDQLVSLRHSYSNEPQTVYRQRTRAFLELVRETWERAIEQVLFQNTVVRYQSGMTMGNLRGLDVQLTDVTVAYDGWKLCCSWVHDATMSGGPPGRTPDQLRDVVNEIVHWTHGIKSRRSTPYGVPNPAFLT